MLRPVWLFSLLSVLVASTQLTACSETGFDAPTDPPSSRYYRPESYSSLNEELKSAQLYCAPGAVCPAAIGMIYSKMVDEQMRPAIGACTGFLISDNVVATNSHCIPAALKRPGASCNEDLLIRFLGPDSSTIEIHACKKILSFSSVETYAADDAFFEIEPTGRRPLSIARAGLQDHQRIRSVRVTPLQNGNRGGVIDSETCEIVLGSMLNMIAATPWSPTGTAVGCSVQHGNSGSPVLNEQGDVLGILQSMSTDNLRSLLETKFHELGMNFPPQLPKHFQFTNMTCVADPIVSASLDSRCKEVESYNVFTCVNPASPESQANYNAKALEWINQLPEIFAYEFITDVKTAALEARPSCVMPSARHASAHIGTEYQGSMRLNPRLSVDAQLRVLPMIFETGVGSSRFIELEKRKGDWQGLIYSRVSSTASSKTETSKIVLKECLPAQIQAKTEMKSPNFIRTTTGALVTEAEYLRTRTAPDVKPPICR